MKKMQPWSKNVENFSYSSVVCCSFFKYILVTVGDRSSYVQTTLALIPLVTAYFESTTTKWPCKQPTIGPERGQLRRLSFKSAAAALLWNNTLPARTHNRRTSTSSSSGSPRVNSWGSMEVHLLVYWFPILELDVLGPLVDDDGDETRTNNTAWPGPTITDSDDDDGAADKDAGLFL